MKNGLLRGGADVMPENLAVPAVVTLAYAGVLAGPAAIGFISHLSSLSVAFLIMTVLLIGVSGSIRL